MMALSTHREDDDERIWSCWPEGFEPLTSTDRFGCANPLNVSNLSKLQLVGKVLEEDEAVATARLGLKIFSKMRTWFELSSSSFFF